MKRQQYEAVEYDARGRFVRHTGDFRVCARIVADLRRAGFRAKVELPREDGSLSQLVRVILK